MVNFKRLYWGIVIYLVVVISLFTWFTRSYQP
jgi:hypothetical protein